MMELFKRAKGLEGGIPPSRNSYRTAGNAPVCPLKNNRREPYEEQETHTRPFPAAVRRPAGGTVRNDGLCGRVINWEPGGGM